MVVEILASCQNNLDQLKFRRKLDLVFTISLQPLRSKNLILDSYSKDFDPFLFNISSLIGTQEEVKLEVRSLTGLIHRFVEGVIREKEPLEV